MINEYKCIKPNIFAVQYDGENINEILEFCEGKATTEEINLTKYQSTDVYIETNRGEVICNKNDFIIKNMDDEFYPVREAVFNVSYKIITKEK